LHLTFAGEKYFKLKLRDGRTGLPPPGEYAQTALGDEECVVNVSMFVFLVSQSVLDERHSPWGIAQSKCESLLQLASDAAVNRFAANDMINANRSYWLGLRRGENGNSCTMAPARFLSGTHVPDYRLKRCYTADCSDFSKPGYRYCNHVFHPMCIKDGESGAGAIVKTSVVYLKFPST
jgi:hypothetical protein